MANDDRRPSPRLRLMGLWLNETKDGKKYMAGNLGSIRVEVWKNDRPEGENPPDYHVTVTEAQRKERRDR